MMPKHQKERLELETELTTKRNVTALYSSITNFQIMKKRVKYIAIQKIG